MRVCVRTPAPGSARYVVTRESLFFFVSVVVVFLILRFIGHLLNSWGEPNLRTAACVFSGFLENPTSYL